MFVAVPLTLTRVMPPVLVSMPVRVAIVVAMSLTVASAI